MRAFLFLILSLLLATTTFLIDILARHFYLYWTTSWLDLFVHFLGGLSAISLYLWFYFFSGLFKKHNIKDKSFQGSMFVYLIIISILWEIYEYHVGLTHYSAAFVFDTISDLAMDLCGGIFGYLLVYYSQWQRN